MNTNTFSERDLHLISNSSRRARNWKAIDWDHPPRGNVEVLYRDGSVEICEFMGFMSKVLKTGEYRLLDAKFWRELHESELEKGGAS